MANSVVPKYTPKTLMRTCVCGHWFARHYGTAEPNQDPRDSANWRCGECDCRSAREANRG